ncbi:hypothetical protein [Streptomyces sp. CBMA152]|uniref:hypothetical protein n=1 Tax=Streptomyces sp. CBMA152 TaxID=1896312 RepID=UPI001CB70B9E|nr:hypothetical protein [Streptomyces sp. CBMA152]
MASSRPITPSEQHRPAPVGAPAPIPLRQATPATATERPPTVVTPQRAATTPVTARPTPQPVVQRRPAAPQPTPPAPTPVIQPTLRNQPPPTPTIQRSQSTAPAPRPTASAPTPQPAAAPSPEPPDEPADLDALARRLVAPLSRLLRAELRGDRERIGRLRDR